MDLRSLLPLGAKKELLKNYLALRVGTQGLTGVLWTVADGKVDLGKLEHQTLSSLKEEDFLPAADRVLSTVSQEVTPEPKDILFGLPADWVVDGKIIEPYLPLLRKASRELGLNPLGFVILPEAIANYYKELESTPLTAVLVGIEVAKLYVTLIRAGKIVKTEAVEVVDSSDLNILIETALKKFTEIEVLPSRILIYDGVEDLELLKNQILSYPWTQKLSFLHFPKVEAMRDTDLARAVAIAGGTEMGGEVLAAPPPEPEAQTGEPAEQQPEEESLLPVSETPPPSAATGFVVEKDIKDEVRPQTSQKVSVPTAFAGKLPSLPKFGLNIPRRLPVLIGGVLAGVLILAVLGYFVLVNVVMRNQVILTVTPKLLEGQKNITVVTSGQVGDSDPQILATEVQVSENGAKRGVATGKKIVGEKAKGTITIYNTTIGHTFTVGSAVTNGNLKFTMDDSVDVATGSAASPATATVNVTASGIGDSFNLAAGTLFEIGDYPQSSFQGKNDSAFAGGSSHQVLVVTKSDEDRLAATLSAELAAKGLGDLKAKLAPGQNLLDQAVTQQVISQKFDKAVDDEADSVGLTMSLEMTGVTIDESQLAGKMGNLLADQIPADFDFDVSRATATVGSSSLSKDGHVVLTTSLSAKLLPKIDRAAIAKAVAGKSLTDAQDYLKTMPQYADGSILTTPGFLSGLNVLSPNPKNISVEIISK